MVKYSDWSNEDLYSYLSDYYKDVHGIRPRIDGLFDNRERMIDMIATLDEMTYYDEPDDGMTDAEADADTLKSCGWGTDEDYGCFKGDDF